MTGRSLRCSLSFLALALAAAPLHAETIKVKAGEVIQTALDTAVDGDIVSVAKGVYNERLTMSVAGVTLKGSGATVNGEFLGSCLTITANNVTVQGMILVNGGGGVAPPLDGEPLPDAGGVLATGDGIVLSKLTVNSCEDFGIQLTGNAGTVESCKVDACLSEGISVTTTDVANSTATIVSKNTVSRCNDGLLLDVGPFTVQSNTSTFNNGEGIEVDLTTTDNSTGTVISKNKSNNNAEAGLIVSTSGEMGTRVLVEKNTMDENNEGCLIEGSDMDVISNTVSDSATTGLLIDAILVTLDKNKVTNSGGVGIRIEGGNNTLTKNTVQNSGSDGIYITGINAHLTGNTVKDGEGDGIQVVLAVTGTELTDNTVSGNEHDGIDNSGLLTLITENNSKSNGGADIAGRGNGGGTVDEVLSIDNKVSDDSDITTYETVQELEMPQP